MNEVRGAYLPAPTPRGGSELRSVWERRAQGWEDMGPVTGVAGEGGPARGSEL